MKRNILLSLFSVMVLAGLLLVACQPAAPTEAPHPTPEPDPALEPMS